MVRLWWKPTPGLAEAVTGTVEVTDAGSNLNVISVNVLHAGKHLDLADDE